MKALNSPLFCLTSDVDWASEYALRHFLALVCGYGIKPTIFATHPSPVLEEAHASGAIELGIHPNFLPGSSHGGDALSVIKHVCQMFPQASTFRSHSFYDSSRMTEEMVRRGFKYDSNLCLYLQPNLVPLRHGSGLVRFPVFWEDDSHWVNTGGDWNLERYLADFTSPGLKILNFHPFNVIANIPSENYYQSAKKHITTLGAENIASVRYNGEGVQTFLRKLLEFLSARGERFYTLAELYQMLPLSQPLAWEAETAGRQTAHSDEDYSALR